MELVVIDAHNYDIKLPEINRIAVRGIIKKDNKFLMIDENTGNVKFPGGGQEPHEDHIATLLREVKEETGYSIDIDTVEEFLLIEEKRKSVKEEMIWHQYNYYYLCDLINMEQVACSFSEHEKTLDLQLGWYTVEEARTKISRFCEERNRVLERDREYIVLSKLMEF